MKFRVFKGRRGDEISFEVKVWLFLVSQHCPHTPKEQGKRRSAEQGPLGSLAYAKKQCGSLTRAWFLDEHNSSHFSGFISNSFNVIVKRNRHKVCFGTAHCVASLSSKLPIAGFFQKDASANPIQTKITSMCLSLKLNGKCDAISVLSIQDLKPCCLITDIRDAVCKIFPFYIKP